MKITFKNFELSWKFPFFQKKAVVRDIVAYEHPTQSPAYVYNAGEDFEGTWAHLFGQTNVIKGGIVTRIEPGEEWMTAGRLDSNLHSGVKERTIFSPNGIEIISRDHCITHTASELANNLENWSKGQLVVLSFWGGRDVDIARINTLIAGAMEERIAKVNALSRRKEKWAKLLRDALLPALETEMRRKAEREENAKNSAFDLTEAARAYCNAEYVAGSPSFTDIDIAAKRANIRKRLEDAGIDTEDFGSDWNNKSGAPSLLYKQ